MKIGIIGSGNVGQALAMRWSTNGHEVVFGSRRPSDAEEGVVRTVGIRQAAEISEVIVICVPWNAVRLVLQETGPLAGKPVIDCTNPLNPGLSGLELGLTTSAAEQIADWVPQAAVFKAFNTTGAENIASTVGYSPKPVMFVCGDHADRKPTVLSLASELGFEAVDAGDLSAARLLEPMAMLWIYLSYKQKLGRDFAF